MVKNINVSKLLPPSVHPQFHWDFSVSLDLLVDPWIHLQILAHKLFLFCLNNCFSSKTTLESTFIMITMDPKLLNGSLDTLCNSKEWFWIQNCQTDPRIHSMTPWKHLCDSMEFRLKWIHNETKVQDTGDTSKMDMTPCQLELVGTALELIWNHFRSAWIFTNKTYKMLEILLNIKKKLYLE